MARDRGRDNPARARKRQKLRREVYVFTEGEVTEPGFITFVTKNGIRKDPRHEVVCKVENRSAPSKRRKPLPLVDEAITSYLGRSYRLRVEEGGTGQAQVRLVAGRLVMPEELARNPIAARRALIGWYRQTGQRWAQDRLQPWAARMEVSEPDVVVRDVGNRWGTYRAGDGPHGTMALHWALFQLPAHLVDYVIAHELAHIRVSGHGADYWALLRQAIPECEERKEELDDLGRRLWLGHVRERL